MSSCSTMCSPRALWPSPHLSWRLHNSQAPAGPHWGSKNEGTLVPNLGRPGAVLCSPGNRPHSPPSPFPCVGTLLHPCCHWNTAQEHLFQPAGCKCVMVRIKFHYRVNNNWKLYLNLHKKIFTFETELNTLAAHVLLWCPLHHGWRCQTVNRISHIVFTLQVVTASMQWP